MICGIRKVVIGQVTCSGRNQARKSGENRYSFSNPLWFELRHHFFVEKGMSYVILGKNRLCHFFYKKQNKTFYDAKLIF